MERTQVTIAAQATSITDHSSCLTKDGATRNESVRTYRLR